MHSFGVGVTEIRDYELEIVRTTRTTSAYQEIVRLNILMNTV